MKIVTHADAATMTYSIEITGPFWAAAELAEIARTVHIARGSTPAPPGSAPMAHDHATFVLPFTRLREPLPGGSRLVLVDMTEPQDREGGA